METLYLIVAEAQAVALAPQANVSASFNIPYTLGLVRANVAALAAGGYGPVAGTDFSLPALVGGEGLLKTRIPLPGSIRPLPAYQ